MKGKIGQSEVAPRKSWQSGSVSDAELEFGQLAVTVTALARWHWHEEREKAVK
jgi:hypothetical protein